MLALSRFACVMLGAALACKTVSSAPVVVGGNAARGKQAIARYGCGGCHVIPGIEGARGRVGPRLDDLAGRMYIAGVMENEPNRLVSWIMNPQAIDSLTAMPTLGVSLPDARDIAEYLYRLRVR